MQAVETIRRTEPGFFLSFLRHCRLFQLFARDTREQENKFREFGFNLSRWHRAREFPRDFRPILPSFHEGRGRDFTRADDGIIFRLGVNLKLPGGEH